MSEKKKAVRPIAVQQPVQGEQDNSEWDSLVEQTIAAASIGQEIRRLRLKRSMGLVDLGRRTGLSASFLSQLETGKVVPTLRNLSRIALVFGCGLEHFFRIEKGNSIRISRAKNRLKLTSPKANGTLMSESMSVLIPDRSLVPCIADFPVSDADVTFFPEIFNGGELVYMLTGCLTFKSSSQTEVLDAGDVFWTDAGKTRHYINKAGAPAKAIIVTYTAAG